jgi:hypothetical protein
MTDIELKSRISDAKAEEQYARNMAELSFKYGKKEDAEIWETVCSAYCDLADKLSQFLKKGR